jgi:competence protein ComEC
MLAWLGHTALDWMMAPTVWLAEFGAASFDAAAAPWWLTAAAMLGLVLAIMPYGFPYRNMAWLLMAPALFWRPERPPDGAWDLYALDVGQSSAIVIRTARHALLFDTGLRGSASFDEGARTIRPFLRSHGIRKLDVLVVSHADIDHAGGARSLLNAMKVGQSYSSFDLESHLKREARLLGDADALPPLPLAMSPCEYGMRWEIDGVSFTFLWPLAPDSFGSAVMGPPRRQRKQRNDYSCVLQVQGRYHSALLPGDIGMLQEATLLDRGLGPVDIVLAAHHGSKGSSTPSFVQTVQARHVIAQAGAWNRYGHPSPEVEQRWQNAGAAFWRTDKHGAIHAQSRLQGLAVQSTRQRARRYWQTD